MSNALLIVESPAKAKTIKKYLGAQFEILASYGHVRDLLPKKGSVEPDQNFAMHYALIEKNEKHIQAITKAMKKADALYLATDPDREGEAIAWHVYTVLQTKKILAKKPVHRVVFHEITKTAVQAAITHPRDISMELVNAQQARRALDYLVGFNLSPLLWRKVRRGLSAGRVQSPALRLIATREEEIERFVAQEYWDISSDLKTHTQVFQAKLVVYQGEKLSQFSMVTAEQAKAAEETLIQEAHGTLLVDRVERKQRKRHPAAPFITSTLQQEAARKYGMPAARTMRIAQQLYEGIDIGEGAIGLITYMRTDSVHLANEAIAEIRAFIEKRYGQDHVPDEIRHYKTRARNAQEAHEAIRPTSVLNTPDALSAYLTPEQLKVYELIWKRTVSCQMISATIDTVTADLLCGKNSIFRATGSVITQPGFMRVYEEESDEDAKESGEHFLPQLTVKETVQLEALHAHQHFTEPPPRYSEATLIKVLEEYGIGRPSTYASIVSTLQNRDYVILDNKRFHPTAVGRIVNKFLTQYFTRYVDYGFTAQLEDELDAIARGEKAWVPVLEAFWQPFKHQVDDITETVKRKDVTQEALEEKCPQCEKPLILRLGQREQFIGCTGYPDCKYTRSLADSEEEKSPAEVIADRNCTACGSPLQIKFGRYGKFLGCSRYPECTHVEPLKKPEDTHVGCPICHQGTLLKRISRRKKYFYSCARYPDCKYAIWNEPIAKACPKCQWPLLTLKITKRRGSEWVCPQEACKFSEPAPEKGNGSG